MSDLIRIGEVRATRHGTWQRLSVRVGSRDLWFETNAPSLKASYEGLLGSLLVPALHHGVVLECNGQVCPRWKRNIAEIAAQGHRWWDYAQEPPLVGLRTTPSQELVGPSRTMLCFSGGVDSFYSLRHYTEQVDYLVCAHGFDIPLCDSRRFQSLAVQVRQVAELQGLKVVLVRTNLRSHPICRKVPWNRAHGGALAALGHLLTPIGKRIVIASSVWKGCDVAWGSHWALDSFWSSGNMEVRHHGEHKSRAEKIRAVAHDPLAHERLRVCWEHRRPMLNCSCCDKCLNTMLVLQQTGCLESFTVFTQPRNFVKRIDALPSTVYLRTYQELLASELPAELRGAIRRLLDRTRTRTPASSGGLRAA